MSEVGIKLVPARPNSELFWEEVFEHYWKQGITDSGRSYVKTAEFFSLTPEQVRSRAQRYHWQERIDARAAAITKKMDEKAIEKVAEIKKRYFTKLDGFIAKWFDHHFGSDEHKQLTLAMTGPDDMLKLMKMAMVLMGQPDTIRQIEGQVKHVADDLLDNLTVEDLQAIVSKRAEKAKPLEKVIDVEPEEDKS